MRTRRPTHKAEAKQKRPTGRIVLIRDNQLVARTVRSAPGVRPQEASRNAS
jgi:hypothetical protein